MVDLCVGSNWNSSYQAKPQQQQQSPSQPSKPGGPSVIGGRDDRGTRMNFGRFRNHETH